MILGALSHDRQQLLQQLRAMILDDQDPLAGINATRHHLHRAEGDPPWRAWLEILLAEAHQRRGSYWTAGNHLREAAQQARTPQLARQALVVAGVSADVAVCDRHLDAVHACAAYLQAAQHSEPLESVEQVTQRFALASVLRAIAIYHHQSCEEARRQLHMLLPAEPDPGGKPATATVSAVKTALAPMVTATIAAMDDGCRPGCLPPPPPLSPLPGGVLCPELAPVPVAFGASRVAPPGVGPRKVAHTCALLSSGQQR